MITAEFTNLGPIKKGTIKLNDLTIIAGENNSGKTYAAYTIYGFLNNTYRHKAEVSAKDGINIKDIAKKLLLKGTADIKIDDNKLKTLKEDAVKILSESYSEDLHEFFSSERKYFKNTKVNFNIDNSNKTELKIVFKKKGDKNENFIKISCKTNKLIFTLAYTEKIPQFIIEDMVNDVVIGLLVNKQSPFIITAERLGISLFYKDLDVAKNRVVEILQKMENKKQRRKLSPFDIIDKFSSRYAGAIQDNIDYIRDLDTHSKKISDINTAKLFDYIKNMMNAYYKVDKNERRLISKKRTENDKFDIPLHLASSSTRGFLQLYFFLKFTAKKGQLLIIDEPEGHLSPKNQIYMARLLAMCVNAGVKVLVTTHSDYFIQEINNLIMLNSIDEKDYPLKEYKKEMILSEKKVSGYICEKGTINECKIDKFGLEVTIFDNTIAKINKISRHLTATLGNEDD